MPNTHTTLTSLFTAVANAIRTKKGTTATIVADDFPTQILSIPTGGTPRLQAKPATPTTSQQTVTPDAGFDGLSSVEVEAVTSAIDSNIQSANIKEGVSVLGVEGNYQGEPPTLQEKTIQATDVQQTVTPDAGFDGLSEVTVNGVILADRRMTENGVYLPSAPNIGFFEVTVDVQPDLQAKPATPATTQFSVTPDAGFDGLSSVEVEAVTSAIDSNIQSANIKDGVSVLGVLGTLADAKFPNETLVCKGTFTPAANITTDYDIMHGGTRPPDFFVLWVDDPTTISAYCKWAMVHFKSILDTRYTEGWSFVASGTNLAPYPGAQYAGYGIYPNGDTAMTIENDSTCRLQANIEYKWEARWL